MGIIATDALRILGLQAIFSMAKQGGRSSLAVCAGRVGLNREAVRDPDRWRVHVSNPLRIIGDISSDRGLTCRLIVLGLEEDHDYIQRVRLGREPRATWRILASESEIRLAIEIAQDGLGMAASAKVMARLLESATEAHTQHG